MANNYKVKMKDIQNKYKFKIFCAGYEYDDTEIKSDIASLQNDVSGLQTSVSQKANITESGRYIDLELNTSTYVLTAKLKDKNNNLISTSTQIDLPLETMIVDAEYDSENKAIILTLQNGNTLSVPIGDLISGLVTQDDLDEVVDELEATKEELNQYKTIYNVLPKVEDEGETLTLDNTGNATLKMDLKGNTSQSGEPTPDAPIPVNVVSGDNTITSCGRNLAYTGWAEDFVARINDSSKATITTKDNRRCLYWVASAGYPNYDTKYTFTTNWKENTQYTILFDLFANSTNGYGDICIEYTDGTKQEINGTYNTWVHKTTTSTSGKTIKNIHTYYRAENSYIDLDTFMVYEGTETLPYEPYQAQNYSVNLGVENLFDKVSAVAGQWYYQLQEDGTIKISRNWGNDGRSFLSNITLNAGTYTLSYIPSLSGTDKVERFSIKNGTTNTDIVNTSINITDGKKESYTFTLSATSIIQICIMANGVNGGTLTLDKIQLEKGTKANSYSEYGTTPIELCKIGDYQDYLYKDSGKWYLHKEVQKTIVSKDNLGEVAFDNTGSVPLLRVLKTIFGRGSSWGSGYTLVNKYKEINSNPNVASGTFATNFAQAYINFWNNEFTNATTAKEALDGTIVYMGITTPTTTEITDTTLISQLNALESAMSYKGQTNISQINNDAPFIIDATALKDLSNL